VEEEVLQEAVKNETLKVYPNPANELLFIESEITLKNVSLLVRDVTGKVLFTKNADELINFTIDLTQFVPGSYILTIGTEDKSEIRKFIIIR
jgi:hypothetical protein